MSQDPILALVERQEWLAPVQKTGEEFVRNAFEAGGPTGRHVKDFLHGVWLGHPLHAAITDVPVGSWTVAAVLDALESSNNDEYAPGADAAVAIGLVGAVASAAAGLTDWSETQGGVQRVGALHGLLNVGAAALYTASYVARKTGHRACGRALGFVGYGVVLASAFLGGALSYTQKIGVNHSPDVDTDLPEDFVVVCRVDDLPEGQLSQRDLKGTPVVLLKRGASIKALANQCSHLGGPLAEGQLEGDSVVCPWHGSRFCLNDGEVLNGPATTPQPTFDVKLEDGNVLIRRRTLS
jgi:nitrite reductase/ring-hydroxylating ferredoxin subunit